METTRLSTKGQIILPKDIREAHSWKAGTEFVVEETAGGVLLRPVAVFPRTTLDDVAGCLHKYVRGRKPKTLAQMDAGVAEEVRRRHKAGRY